MILDDILAKRREQLEREKAAYGGGIGAVKREAEKISAAAMDFFSALKSGGAKVAVIGEVKKASPSRGVLREDFFPGRIALEYEKAGAAAISVLTEEHYFQGNNLYLKEIKNAVKIPVLRKDFCFDPFQIYHARAMGADAVLLISEILTLSQIKEFVKTARDLSLHVLAEGHDEAAVEQAQNAGAVIIGVNNRDLTTFKTDLSVTEKLMKLINPEYAKVSESGVLTPDDMRRVKNSGCDAVLIGEGLIKNGGLLAGA